MKSPTYYELYTGNSKKAVNDYADTYKTKESALRAAKEEIQNGNVRYAEVVEAKILYHVHATVAQVIEYK